MSYSAIDGELDGNSGRTASINSSVRAKRYVIDEKAIDHVTLSS